MGLRINTNLPSIAAQRTLSQSQRKLDSNMRQLATGSRFADPATGSADFAIAERLRGQIRGTDAGRLNAENAISFVQVAEGALNEQNNILVRMRELSVQAASDTFGDSERGMIDLEFQQLKSELDRIAQSTRFGSHKLLVGERKSYEFQVGADSDKSNVIRYETKANTTARALDVSSLSVSDRSDARSAIADVDSALETLAQTRSSFGATQSRLESASANASIQSENLQAAHSRLADTDFAQATSEMFKQQALQQYQVAVLSQANQFPLNVLKLVG